MLFDKNILRTSAVSSTNLGSIETTHYTYVASENVISPAGGGCSETYYQHATLRSRGKTPHVEVQTPSLSGQFVRAQQAFNCTYVQAFQI